MKKVTISIFTLLVAMLPLISTTAQIKPVTMGEFVEKNCIATDPAIKLVYDQELGFYGMKVSEVEPTTFRYTYTYFTITLGTTAAEAIESLDALIGCIDDGNTNKVYDLGNGMTAKMYGGSSLQVIKEGYAFPTIFTRLHLKKAKAMLSSLQK